MTPSPKRRAVLMGIFVVTAVAILGGGVLTIGDLNDTFTKKISATAVFDGVNGLQQGDNIWFSGVKVGIVKSLTFQGAAEVAVALRIDRDATKFIRADSLVKIGSDGLIGNRIVVIYGGRPGSPALEDGGTLSIGKTVTSEEIMTVLQENNTNLLAITADLKSVTHQLTAGQGTLGRLLQEDALYTEVAQTVTTLGAASDSARALAASGASFAGRLNEKGTLASDLSRDRTTWPTLTRTVATLQTTGSRADSLVDGLADRAEDPRTVFGAITMDPAAGEDVKQTLDHLNRSSVFLAEDLAALQHNFLFRGYFRKLERDKAKAEKAAEKAQKAADKAEKAAEKAREAATP